MEGQIGKALWWFFSIHFIANFGYDENGLEEQD
jgi:hypothetical protein